MERIFVPFKLSLVTANHLFLYEQGSKRSERQSNDKQNPMDLVLLIYTNFIL